MGIAKNVADTTKTFTAVLSLGLVGLLFLIIFGNLSGNLGFSDDNKAVAITNETVATLNSTAYTLVNANSSTSNHVMTAIWGNTPNQVQELNNSIGIGNATISSVGVVTNSSSTLTNETIYNNLSFSYTLVYSFPSQASADTDAVIFNLTGGAVTFFGFANVWFVLLAVTLLIIIVISVIKIVGGKGIGMKGEGRSTFPT